MTFIINLQQAIWHSTVRAIGLPWTDTYDYEAFLARLERVISKGKNVFRTILLIFSVGTISDASPHSPPNSSTSLPRVNLMFAAPGTVPTSSGMTGTMNSAAARPIGRNLNQNFTFCLCTCSGGTPLSVYSFYLILLTFRDDLGSPCSINTDTSCLKFLCVLVLHMHEKF